MRPGQRLAASYLRCAPERVLWGSDWPHVSALAGMQPLPDDARQIDRLADWTSHAGGAATLQRVLVDNPRALYGFETAAPTSLCTQAGDKP